MTTGSTSDLRADRRDRVRVPGFRPAPAPRTEGQTMSLLDEEIYHDRIRRLEDEVSALQWAAEVRRSRREALAKAALDTGRATRQEARIRFRGLRTLIGR